MKAPKGKHIFGTVKVGEKGQIVIPKDARALFGIQPGDSLVVLGDEAAGLALIKSDAFLSQVAGAIFRTAPDAEGKSSPEQAAYDEIAEQVRRHANED